jgi:hypothetical protein
MLVTVIAAGEAHQKIKEAEGDRDQLARSCVILCSCDQSGQQMPYNYNE